ncbi:FkbM family methyltransferase [Singulisphaera rosea]
MIKKFIRLGEILSKPNGLKALMGWKPFSISSFLIVSAMRRKGIVFRTIIDAGANVGQFARTSKEIYPEATIYSFEPLAEVAKTFRTNLADSPKVHLFETALGSHDGTIQFFPNEYSQSSSALPLQDEDKPKHAGQRHLAPIDVPVKRLDTILADKALERPIRLVLDPIGHLQSRRRGPRLSAQSHGQVDRVAGRLDREGRDFSPLGLRLLATEQRPDRPVRGEPKDNLAHREGQQGIQCQSTGLRQFGERGDVPGGSSCQ